jgi:hypothetical protein
MPTGCRRLKVDMGTPDPVGQASPLAVALIVNSPQAGGEGYEATEIRCACWAAVPLAWPLVARAEPE